ncbi:M1 family metallopeptidase [Bacillus sp. LBA3-1-1.1]|uniref:M1 family metallopeptidase n=1 Tax=Bacillus TaxID=1386 RepID=UPI0034393678
MKRSTLRIQIVICSTLVFMICIYGIWSKYFRTVPAKEIVKEFIPQEIKPGSKSAYNLQLEMNTDGLFNVEASISIQNQSDKDWSELLFYFIPNIFTKEYTPQMEKDATVRIKELSVNGKNTLFNLADDTLTVPLNEKISPGTVINVRVSYDFRLPEHGNRFSKNGENYYLAQWYPMVPTFRNEWNKQAYRAKGEFYHTSFSDFTLKLKLPPNYTVVTSSESDTFPSNNTSTMYAKNVKEMFVAVLKEPHMIEKEENGVNIRVFSIEDKPELLSEASLLASKALTYFQQVIGKYPSKQLDIILDEKGMEYPGIATVGSISQPTKVLEHHIVHEIAHQWFYGVVNNDPYYHAWLDEGVAQLATTLFLSTQENRNINEIFHQDLLPNMKRRPSNLPLDKYPLEEQSNYIYGQPASGLWNVFNKNGGQKTAEQFLKQYYETYQYKEVDTQEFVTFLKHYLKLKDNKLFNDWLQLDKDKLNER